MTQRRITLAGLLGLATLTFTLGLQPATMPAQTIELPTSWTDSGVLVDATAYGEPDWVALKDPSIVFHDGKWHMFNTLRGHERSHAMTYMSFDTLEQMGQNKPVVLENHTGYWGAPHVFYFEPHGLWYMLCQAKRDDWSPAFQGAFCTNDDINDPAGWTPLESLGVAHPPGDNPVPYLDFWLICDDTTAHLFYTTDNGKMWRSETPIADFPHGWTEPSLDLDTDLFEASHIYYLPEQGVYLNLVERMIRHGLREFDAYLADDLAGPWRPASADDNKLYAKVEQVDFPGERWTDSISHGELIRLGVNEKMEAEADAPFVYQGVAREDMRGVGYGKIPWKLAILRPRDDE